MKWWNVDLPNLTSINSEKDTFQYPLVVTLESISEYWLLIVFRYSKSSKCQATLSFIHVGSIKINFEYWLIDWFDFIHRCSFHSCWFCFLNQKYFLPWICTVHSTQRSLCILLLISIACCDTFRITIHFSIQSINSHQMTNKNINTQSRKMNNGKWSKRTASRLLSESPTLVLTRLVMT